MKLPLPLVVTAVSPFLGYAVVHMFLAFARVEISDDLNELIAGLSLFVFPVASTLSAIETKYGKSKIDLATLKVEWGK